MPTAPEEHALVESHGRNLPLVIWCVPTKLNANVVIRASAIVPLVYALASRVTPVHHANVLSALMTALDTEHAALTRILLMTGPLLKPSKLWEPKKD